MVSGLAWSRWALVLAASGLLGTAHAALFEDDEARRAILDLRQRVEQSNTAIKSLGDENAQLRQIGRAHV